MISEYKILNNPALHDALKKALSEGKIKPKYFDGYKGWKSKFNYWQKKTKNVDQTLDVMYGKGGGVKNYKGSITANSNFNHKPIAPKQVNKKHSNAFKFIKIQGKNNG